MAHASASASAAVGAALLIVDIQYDFLPGGSLAVSDSDQILPPILSLTTDHAHRFDAVIATQDYHPRNHISFASNHAEEGDEPFTEKTLPHPTIRGETIRQMLWPEHCIQGTRGCEIHEDIVRGLCRVHEATTDVIVVRKGDNPNIDGYSALSDNSYTRFTPLIRYLSSTQRLSGSSSSSPIEIVVVVGLALDYCVLSSAMDLLKHGLHVVLPLDCSRAVTPDGKLKALDKLRTAGAVIVDTYEDALQYTTTAQVKPFMQVIREAQDAFWKA